MSACREKGCPLTAEQQAMVAEVMPAVRTAIYRKAQGVRRFWQGFDDVAQEAYWAACRAALTWMPERGAFLNYARTAALKHLDRLMRDGCRLKRQAPPPQDPNAKPNPEPPAPPPPVSEAEIEEALLLLPPDELAVVRSYMVGGNPRRAAGRLGLPVDRFHYLLSQAQARIAKGESE